MTQLARLRGLVAAIALLASQGCKPESARKADRAADKVTDTRSDLRDVRRDLGKKMVEQTARSKEIVEKSGELATAEAEFRARRNIRVQELSAEHALIATQPMVIDTLAQAYPITSEGRARLAEGLEILRMRLDETGTMIAALKSAGVAEWKQRDDAVIDAMKRLDDARKDAWKTLDDAPRTNRSS
jgi:chromosome segregation ATPase